MAYTTVDDPTIYFITNLRSGLYGGSDTAFDIGFQPDWIWDKRRSDTSVHALFDSVRGFGASGKVLYSNTNDAEATNALIKSVSSTGFTVTASSDNTGTLVDWCWKAGTSFSNSSGSNGANLDSTGSVSTTAGFSIVSFTGNRSATRNIYHGLGAVPKMIIFKNRDTTNGWTIYNETIGNANKLTLNATNASGGCTACFASTTPTSTLFTVGDDSDTNGTSNDMIAYCFADVKGFSKVGSFVGNGNADGPFVHTGFKPAWILTKKTTETSEWHIYDNKRVTINPNNNVLSPNLDAADSINANCNTDFLSNGFKLRNTNDNRNDTGETHIYMAFAESPFVNSNGVPTNAK